MNTDNWIKMACSCNLQRQMTKQRSIGLHNTGAEYKLTPFDQKIHNNKINLNGT
jgi:hypothetical protein